MKKGTLKFSDNRNHPRKWIWPKTQWPPPRISSYCASMDVVLTLSSSSVKLNAFALLGITHFVENHIFINHKVDQK
jgi:hypothetical protein